MDKFAALDLGTNTFHLLVASFDERGQLIEHFRRREYIHLAKDGIDEISAQAYTKAINCIISFAEELGKFKIDGIKCSGTAALRTASNGPALVQDIERILGVKVNVIDGITEAKLIYQGVQLAVPALKSGNHLIMDIGGGSVEFIVIKDSNFIYSNSYPIGIAVLKKQFHITEPITRDEILLMKQFIRDHIRKLLYLCRGIKFESLIGASGSFEVLSKIFDSNSEKLSVEVPINLLLDQYDAIIKLDLKQRLERDDIPDDRAHLIVVAFQLMEYVVSNLQIKKILVSKYAMKEGMLFDFLR